uniref:Uncharacterized protein n=1 Tax=Parastrongyloides trichosuri TaxID=131310 RepID=A0A0N4ZE96_PARTI
MELPNGFKIVNDTSEILRFREDIKKTKSKLDKHYGRRKDDTYKERDPNEVKASQITSISYCDYPYHLYDHHYCYSHHSHNHSYYVEQPKKYAIEYGDCERY